MYFSLTVLFALLSLQHEPAAAAISTPPKTETPLLLDSFIPAGMQIIAYFSELMKYDLKPMQGSTTTSTTLRPTPSHKPAIYAPNRPLGPKAFFPRAGLTYAEYVERLLHPSADYFSRYSVGRDLVSRPSFSVVYGEIPSDLDEYLGRATSDLLKLVDNVSGEDNELRDEGEVVKKFNAVYDWDEFVKGIELREYKKQKPPTRAYVALLSLYDLLNKEAKKLGLNKYGGYKENVLNDLIEMSSGTSTDQLRLVLSKIVQRKDTQNPQILKKINELIKDLEESLSYISAALRYIPPLPFVA